MVFCFFTSAGASRTFLVSERARSELTVQFDQVCYFHKCGLHVIQKKFHVKSPEIFGCTMVTLMYFNVYITGYYFHISFSFMVNCDDINILVEALIVNCSLKFIAKDIHKLFKNLKS